MPAPDDSSPIQAAPATAAGSVLQRVAAGEPGAAQECLDTFGNLVWSVVRKMLGRSTDAEDTVQEVFIELWRHAGRFDPAKGNEVQFVATIARRRTVDRVRRRSRGPALEPLHENMGDDPAAGGLSEDASVAAERGDEVARAQAALAQLPAARQEVLRMALLGGQTHTEISASTGMPLGTVKTHVRRGLMRLRELLGDDADAETAP